MSAEKANVSFRLLYRRLKREYNNIPRDRRGKFLREIENIKSVKSLEM